MSRTFENLAGRGRTANLICAAELAAAQIIVTENLIKPNGEVGTTVFGLLGCPQYSKNMVKFFTALPCEPKTFESFSSFVFTRAWYYWVVVGYVPESVAVLLHQHPDNRGAVRVNGDAGAPAPNDASLTDHLIAGHRCIACYHIDNPRGLKLFADTLRQHKLV